MPTRHGVPPFVRMASHPLRWRLLTELAAGDYRVRELTERVGEPQNLVSYHLRLLRDGGLVTARRSSSDGRDTYYHLDLDRCAATVAEAGAALHPALRLAPLPPAVPAPRSGTVRVLFACTGNSARSPIAEALLRHRGDGRVEASSAGSHPRPRIHPQAVTVLREQFGVDIAGQATRHLDTLAGEAFDYVITLCDRVREVCPDVGGGLSRRVHWSLPDPAADGGDPDPSRPFIRVAAEIDTRIRHLLPVLSRIGAEEVTP